MNIITFNPKYVLKPDSGCALILASLVGRNLLAGIEDSFTNVIHPIYAMILCYINGRDSQECIEDAAKALDIPQDLVSGFVNNLIDNPNQVISKGKDGFSAFPPFTIITQKEQAISERYTPDLFAYEEIDLRLKRHLTPSTITLMLNNICATNCIYCYQDKSRIVNCTIPLDRIKEIIDESVKLHVNTFDVIGGEFFLYKYWKEVLLELRKHGYNPYLSTKMPLEETDIQYLAKLKVHDIQISIDTFIDSHLKDSIGVNEGYARRMINTLHLLDQYGIPIMVHSVLTKYNNSIDDMKSIYDVLKGIRNLVDWHVVKADETLYPKTEYKNIEIEGTALMSIVNYLKTVEKEEKVRIVYPQGLVESNPNKAIKDINVIKDEFFNRSFCSGLFSSLYILPDGQVTMCEQLYWNKDFIIGNIMENSVQEVWNSPKAKSLFYIKQEDIPSDSRCSTCSDFVKCRETRQVCYREIIKKYGTAKWYYPDVKCPYTTKIIKGS